MLNGLFASRLKVAAVLACVCAKQTDVLGYHRVIVVGGVLQTAQRVHGGYPHIGELVLPSHEHLVQQQLPELFSK